MPLTVKFPSGNHVWVHPILCGQTAAPRRDRYTLTPGSPFATLGTRRADDDRASGTGSPPTQNGMHPSRIHYFEFERLSIPYLKRVQGRRAPMLRRSDLERINPRLGVPLLRQHVIRSSSCCAHKQVGITSTLKLMSNAFPTPRSVPRKRSWRPSHHGASWRRQTRGHPELIAGHQRTSFLTDLPLPWQSA